MREGTVNGRASREGGMVRIVETPLIALSQRQQEVLGFIADGHTEVEIASALGISPRTVRMHSDILRTKFGVTRRRQLPLAYRRMLAANGSPD
jgi:DNA-binding CsgD family transcriptional regulator